MSSNIYINPNPRPLLSTPQPNPDILPFHRSLPHYAPTPLVSLPTLAQDLGIKHLLLKNESSRLDLPAFKILGASWATAQALSKTLHLPLSAASSSNTLQHLATAAQAANITLYAATDGNHGRAVARMAQYLGIPATILVPALVDAATIANIAHEGASVTIWPGDYDSTVLAAKSAAESHEGGGKGLLISDTALERGEAIPQWIVDGYSTMFAEIDSQIVGLSSSPVTHVVTPVGVGSLCQAVCEHYARLEPSTRRPAIVTVEPVAAACFKTSLAAGEVVSIATSYTICTGMCCGTVSAAAWPAMKDAVSAAVAVEDVDVETAMRDLRRYGVNAGPCGAATTAGVRLLPDLGPEDVVVVLCTEGERGYEMEEHKA